MANIEFSKQDLPFLLSGNGTLTVHANVDAPSQPLKPADEDVLSITFGAQGGQGFTFGTAGNVKLGIQAGAANRLYALWPTSSAARLQILSDHGLGTFFANHPDQMILVLALDASAAANAAGSFSYSVLTATTTLDVGGNAGYTHLRAYPADAPVQKIFADFLGSTRLPASLREPLPLGEVIAFDFDGYLKIGASLAVGYELKGAPDFTIGQLQLSEHYQFSVAGTLGVNAQVAGEFAVEARAAVDTQGTAKPQRVQVIVRKKRNSAFQIAADAGVSATSDLQGLPDSAGEFLGALLGLRAKNWLNMIARVRELSDLDALKAELDNLGKRFIEEWIGKGFDALSQTEFASLLARVEKVVESYENLDNATMTLFDRYFNKLDFLTEQLGKLKALTSWDQLKGQVDDKLWQVVQQITDGDPLGWILGKVEKKGADGLLTPVPSLDELQARVRQTLDLIQGAAHDEIRKVIGIAKAKFPLDGFIQQLSAFDSIPKLKAQADARAVAFFERLLGTAIDDVKDSQAGQAIARLHQALVKMKTFEDSAYAKFKEAVQSSMTFNLHAEYNRATASDALIDVEIDVSTALGKSFLQAAGRGDFQEVLASYRPDVVRLNQGILTHKVTRSSSLSVNILGWHGGWHFRGSDSVITGVDQQIVAESNGGLSVYTTASLNKERERERQGEKTMTNMLVRFIGESRGALAFDEKNQQYLIDAITGGAVSYKLSFSDEKTPRKRLEYFLSFANAFGLTAEGATIQNLLPLLPIPDPNKDDFGPVEVSYEVRYTDKGLRALFKTPLNAASLRQILRKVVLASYLSKPELSDIGWAYWTQGIYDLWKKGQAEFTSHVSAQEFSPLGASPFSQFPQPARVTLQPAQLQVLSSLFFIEDDFVDGLTVLDSMIHQGHIKPSQFEVNLGKIGSALKRIDDFDGTVNGVFALFDQMVKAQTAGPDARLSSLTLRSNAGAQEVTKVFLAGVAGEAAPLPNASGSQAAAAPVAGDD